MTPILPAAPAGGSGTRLWPPSRAAPTLGQHTDEILRDLLGLPEDEIAALRRDGVA